MSKFPTPKPAGMLSCVAQLSPMEVRNYSLSRLINLEAERAERMRANRPDPGEAGRRLFAAQHGLLLPEDGHQQPTAERSLDSLEYEISAAIAEEVGPPRFGGVYIPNRLRASGLDTKSGAAGNYGVADNIQSIIDYLPAESTVIGTMRATLQTGLKGNVSWPVETAAPTATCVSENPGSDVAADDAGFSQIAAQVKTLQSATSISRKLSTQAVVLNSWLPRRFARGFANKLDQLCLTGSGVSNQAAGVIGHPDVQTLSLGDNGLMISPAAPVAMEKLLADVNVRATGLLSTSGVRAKLRAVPSITSGGVPCWNGDKISEAYPASVSAHMPSTLSKGTSNGVAHALVLADWSSMIIGEYGVTEVVVDIFTGKKTAQIELAAYSDFSISLVRPTAFAVCLDALVA